MYRFPIIFLLAFMVVKVDAQRSDFKTVDFSKADRLALYYSDESLSNPHLLVEQLTKGLDSDVEKFRAIYIWVCTNISNDYAMYKKHMRKRGRFKKDSVKLRDWNEKFKIELFDKLVSKKRTICTGYAYLLEQLCKIAEINCVMVHGYVKTSETELKFSDAPNHSWNAVRLIDKWYLCDPTWASGLTDPTTHRFEFLYNDGYFLTDPELFAVNHYPTENKWLLLKQDVPSFEQFLKSPILYSKAYEILKSHQLPKLFHTELKKKDSLLFQYQISKPILESQIVLVLDDGTASREVQPTIMSLDENIMKFSYQFNSVGFYDVHLLIDNDYVATYTIKVKS